MLILASYHTQTRTPTPARSTLSYMFYQLIYGTVCGLFCRAARWRRYVELLLLSRCFKTSSRYDY